MGIYTDWAEHYSEYDLSVIPCNGKKPAIGKWSDYCKRLPTNREVGSWVTSFGANTAIGMPLGEANNLIAFDFDYAWPTDPKRQPKGITEEEFEIERAQIEETILKLLPNTPCKKVGKPGKWTAFYRPNGVAKTFSITRRGVTVFDVLFEGRQTIIPPSIHPDTKQPYEWIGQDIISSLDLLPSLALKELEDYGNSLSIDAQTNGEKVTAGRNDLLKKASYGMFKRGIAIHAATTHLLEMDIEMNNPPLFSDPDEFPKTYKTPEESALRFVKSNYKSLRDASLKEPKYKEQSNHMPAVPVETKVVNVKKTEGIELITLKDLLEKPDEEVEWTVDNLLPAGGTSIMAAKPKCGKTTILRQLSLCIAQGVPFLTRYCPKGPVIYFSVEEKIDEIKKHFKDMGATGEEQIYVFANRAPKDTIKQLKPIIDEIKPSLIILDTLFKVIRMKDANDYASISEALEPVQELARESKAHIMCVHHAGKADREGGDGILGSTAILGAFDTALMMNRKDDKDQSRTIRSMQRYGTDMEESHINFDHKTRRSELGETKWRKRATDRTQKILDYLKETRGSEVTFADIKDNTGFGKPELLKEVPRLLAGGKITRTGKGSKGNPFLYSLTSMF